MQKRRFERQAVGGRPPQYAAAQACELGDTIYIIHAYGSVTNSMSMLACQWPSTANQSGLVTFDRLTLKVVSESRVMWVTSVPSLVFLGLSVLDLGPMYATDKRQTDVRQHHRLMPPGRAHKKDKTYSERDSVYAHSKEQLAIMRNLLDC